MNVIFEHKVWIVIQHMQYLASGPVQKRPTDFFGALRNNPFQQALIKVLVASWKDDANANIIQDFQICASCETQCFSVKAEVEKVKKVADTSLKCSNEEVDSWILFNAKFISAPKTFVIGTADTDISVITFCKMSKLFRELKTWLEVDITLNKYTALHKCKRNKTKVLDTDFFVPYLVIMLPVGMILLHRLVVKEKLIP